MGKQLDIFNPPKHHFDMGKNTIGQLYAEIEKLKAELEKKDRTISTYKGHFTKQNNKNKK